MRLQVRGAQLRPDPMLQARYRGVSLAALCIHLQDVFASGACIFRVHKAARSTSRVTNPECTLTSQVEQYESQDLIVSAQAGSADRLYPSCFPSKITCSHVRSRQGWIWA